jgi:hypothetical protein
MSDRIPGSSYDNPIWHGKWRIYLSSYAPMGEGYEYVFCHDDYDGAEDAGDNRYGFAVSVKDAKNQIDEMEMDNFEPPTVNNEVV